MKMFGFDTETPMGRLKVVATNEEYAEIETFDEVLDFITQRKYRGSFFFLFNLSYDVNHILKLSGDRELLIQIYKNTERKGVMYKDVTLKYIGDKFFKICKNGHCVTFIDIAMFYKGMSLDKASKKYFGIGKDPIDSQRLGEEKGYYEAHKEDVLRYCQKDASLTLKLAERMKGLIETCKMPKGKLSFRNPISSAKVAEIYIRDNYKYPKVPLGKVDKYHWSAKQAYHGGLFETFQRGVFEQKLYQYDINSAYPFVMQNLPHWANGRFEEVQRPDSGEYGWYFCEFNCEWIPFNDFSKPFEVEFCYGSLKNCDSKIVNPKRKVYPVGNRKAWITKIEYEWLLKFNFYVRFIGGFEWFQKTSKYESPFAWIPEVYERRRAVKAAGDASEYALKIVMNGIYGKTAQFKHGMRRLTNFFYCSYTTAETRLPVAEVALKNPFDIVEIATDSTLLTKKVDLPLSKKLGEWGLDIFKRGVLIGSGIHQFYKDEETFHTHARGLTNNPNWDMEKAMHEFKNDEYVWFTKRRPIKLGEMLMHTKALTFNDLGTFVKVSKKLSCNTDKKRVWERPYRNFKDFLESPIQKSEPLVVKNREVVI